MQGRSRRVHDEQRLHNRTDDMGAVNWSAVRWSYHRRKLGSARTCVNNFRNVLFLFASNVHNTGAGYNSCRNLEWQTCAAMGMLPGQTSATIIFAQPPNSLDAEGERPLAQCGGYSPQGCGKHAYSNDDIFFLEVCFYSQVCANNDELFRLDDGEPFHCAVSEEGFGHLQRLVVSNPVLGHSPFRLQGICRHWCNEWTCNNNDCAGCKNCQG